jgi:hypothetical protein
VNWASFAQAPKKTVETGLTYEQARDKCEEFNRTRNREQIRKGIKLEFTAE